MAQTTRQEIDNLKAGITSAIAAKEEKLLADKRKKAHLHLAQKANEYRTNNGLQPKKVYTYNDLQAHCELAVETPDPLTDHRDLKHLMRVYFTDKAPNSPDEPTIN